MNQAGLHDVGCGTLPGDPDIFILIKAFYTDSQVVSIHSPILWIIGGGGLPFWFLEKRSLPPRVRGLDFPGEW